MEPAEPEQASRARPWWLGALAAAVVPLAILLTNEDFDPRSPPYGADAFAEWIGAWIVWNGDHGRFYEPAYAMEVQFDPAVVGHAFDAGNGFFPLLYPPFYYVAVSPLGLLPPGISALVFYALNLACFAATAAILYRERPALRRWFWLGLPVATVFGPFLANLISNQKGSLLLLLLTTTWALLGRGRRLEAGVVFGLMCFKPQLMLVILGAAAVLRWWRFVAGVALTGTVAGALSLVLGVDVVFQYLSFLRDSGELINAGGYPLARSVNWHAFFKLALSGAGMAAIRGLTVVAVLSTLVLLGRSTARALEGSGARFDLAFAGLVLATALCAPHLLDYDLTIALLPFALIGSWAATHGGDRARPVLWAVAVAFVAPMAALPLVEAVGLQIVVPLYAGLVGLVSWLASAPGSPDASEAG